VRHAIKGACAEVSPGGEREKEVQGGDVVVSTNPSYCTAVRRLFVCSNCYMLSNVFLEGAYRLYKVKRY
jgi:hypothetical protein